MIATERTPHPRGDVPSRHRRVERWAKILGGKRLLNVLKRLLL